MRSMTGFGQAAMEVHGLRVSVEIRSVNQRFLDVKLNMPRNYAAWEKELRALLQAGVARGKVDVTISRGGAGAHDSTVEVNQALAQAYLDGLKRLQRKLRLSGAIDLALVVGRPEVLRMVERRRETRSEIATVRAVVKRALARFNRDREREGRALARDLGRRIAGLRRTRQRMSKRAEELGPLMKQRMHERLQRLLGGVPVNEERLLQEVASQVDRGDVNEELVRLESHLQALVAALRSREPAGRPLDFLLQEVHREINTIASKSADLEMTNLTISARADVEKLREQAQNIE
jgi:uncharacterized protein (TIGR00255 family)